MLQILSKFIVILQSKQLPSIFLFMLKQSEPKHQKRKNWEFLQSFSPQILPMSPLQTDIQDLDLDNGIQVEFNQGRTKLKKLKSQQTFVIAIKPAENEYQADADKQLPAQKTYFAKQGEKEEQIKQQHQNRKQLSNQAILSSILYHLSEEQDIQQKEQAIPQSSRRPLKQKTKIPDSDSPESPIKAINLPSKYRSKKLSRQGQFQNLHRFTKNKKQIQFQQEKIDVYNFNDSEKQEKQFDEEQQSSDENQLNQQQNQNISFNQNQQTSKFNIIVFKSNSFYTLINAQIPKGNFVTCIIKRKRNQSYFEKIVIYELYLLEDKKYLMTCVKHRLLKTTSHFQFYRQKKNSLKFNPLSLYAYLDSNFTGTEFVLKIILKNDTVSEKQTVIERSHLFKLEESISIISDQAHKTTGIFNQSPKSNPLQSKFDSTDEVKQTIFISFKANFFGLAGQKEVKILKKKNKKLKQTGNFSDLKSAQENGQIDKFVEFSSKKAVKGQNGLQLDFKGVARMQSSKNTILEDVTHNQILVFGKIKEDIYTVAIGSPLSILQGLAFGIANLDRKFFVD